jgi:nucleoside-diphosphate-sugar epimerase
MKVIVTGHDGYIGTVLVPVFVAAGHEVVGIDTKLFEGCTFGAEAAEVAEIRKDIRDVRVDDLAGADAVVHLAGISNDPLGDYRPQITDDVNHLATVHVAAMAKAAGVPRFLYSSSCSLYGAHGEAPIDEHADWLPVTPYGQSKVDSELDLMAMADDDFSPTFLRNATAYGVSPRLRGDLVVNNLTGFASTTLEVFMKSDGTPWRPLVHIADIAKAFLLAAEAPRELVHNEAFNVGATSENYQIRDVAEIVQDVVTGSRIVLADHAGPDLRNYRVNCDKIADTLGFRCDWTVRRGVEELHDAYRRHRLELLDLEGNRYMRIRRVKELIESGALDHELRWLDERAEVPA